MVYDQIHDEFHASLVERGDEHAETGKRTEPWVDGIEVCNGVAVIGLLGHVVGEYWSKPESSHAERIDVVDVFADTIEVSTVATVGVIAVF